MLTMLAVLLTFAVCTICARHYVATETVPMDDYLAAQDYCATVEHERDTLARAYDHARDVIAETEISIACLLDEVNA